MQLLKVIALLLNYPDEQVCKHSEDLITATQSARQIPPEMRVQLVEAIAAICKPKLMDSQEQYGLLFDQGRSLSLHLFEHVHGESKDRGQAMVDLMNVYQQNGFEIDCHELPDYLPLFLEYLATRPDLEVREWLVDVAPIIARLSARLYERAGEGNAIAQHHGALLESLLIIAGAQDQLDSLRKEVSKEVPDYTPEAIDQEWEETAVTFNATDRTCGKQAMVTQAQPTSNESEALRWVDPPTTTQSVVQSKQDHHEGRSL